MIRQTHGFIASKTSPVKLLLPSESLDSADKKASSRGIEPGLLEITTYIKPGHFKEVLVIMSVTGTGLTNTAIISQHARQHCKGCQNIKCRT